MTTIAQHEYIRNLSIEKLKDFKEFREMVTSHNITDGDTALNAPDMSSLLNALTDAQSSQIIDVLIAKPTPNWQRRYSDKRISQASDLMDEVLNDIEEWNFGLR